MLSSLMFQSRLSQIFPVEKDDFATFFIALSVQTYGIDFNKDISLTPPDHWACQNLLTTSYVHFSQKLWHDSFLESTLISLAISEYFLFNLKVQVIWKDIFRLLSCLRIIISVVWRNRLSFQYMFERD